MARRKFRKMSDREVEASCGRPRWKDTGRGKRCVRICKDDEGRERWRFVPGDECGSRRSRGEDVTEFSGGRKLEPMPLMDLDAPPRKRRGKR